MLRYKEIKNEILSIVSVMQQGDTLPSRNELCKRLDTARTTVDKAIKELVDEGTLISRKGSGTRVAGLIERAHPDVQNWCVILPNVTEQIYSNLLRGIENVADASNTNIIICNSDNNPDKQEQYIRRLMVSGVSGFVIVPTISGEPKESLRLYDSLVKSKIPFIFCNRGVDGINAPIVKSNDFYGGYIATSHLLSMGYKKIAFIGRQQYSTCIDRCQGYISALMEHNIEINRQHIMMPPPGGILDSYEAMEQLLHNDDIPDAVFCFNDYTAELASKAIKDAGLRVSDDIGIIGYDNGNICESCSPKITSISFKSMEIGACAANLLEDISKGNKPSGFRYYLFQPSIVIRESCQGKK